MLVALTLAIAAAAAPATALAGDPTATPTGTVTPATATPLASGTPVATPTIADLRFNVTDAEITWQPVPDAARYGVEATIIVVRINTTDICEAPAERDSRELSISEDVGADVNARSFGLPEVAPDRWLVVRSQVQITAYDAEGVSIATGAGGRIAETCMGQAEPTPSRQLPTTGSGAPTTDTGVALRAVIATAAATTVVLAGMYGIHRRLRVRE
jgi:hypothetical protein